MLGLGFRHGPSGFVCLGAMGALKGLYKIINPKPLNPKPLSLRVAIMENRMEKRTESGMKSEMSSAITVMTGHVALPEFPKLTQILRTP